MTLLNREQRNILTDKALCLQTLCQHSLDRLCNVVVVYGGEDSDQTNQRGSCNKLGYQVLGEMVFQ
jgi:hypothetical protein